MVSIGVAEPEKFQSADPGGWFRAESIRSANDKAMMSCLMLGIAETDDDIDKFSDFDTYMEYVEQCAEKGFQILKEEVESANWDNGLLEGRMLKKLDLLYKGLVENNIYIIN